MFARKEHCLGSRRSLGHWQAVEPFVRLLAAIGAAQKTTWADFQRRRCQQSDSNVTEGFGLRPAGAKKTQPVETGWGVCKNSQRSETPVLRLLYGQLVDLLHDVIFAVHILDSDNPLAIGTDMAVAV